jgi:hypothetical protein
MNVKGPFSVFFGERTNPVLDAIIRVTAAVG